MKTERTHDRPGYTNDDERSSRDPKVLAAAHKRHVANAAEWPRRIKDFDNQPEGTEFNALVAAYHGECKSANIEPAI